MEILKLILYYTGKAIKFIFVWFILLPFSILVTLAYKKH